ncbi:MAG TPA: hypothetical protein VK638_23105 [Edaphobacter sp.]|nr:hypothetical protein [Edaphobacter sp.]
MSKLNKKINPSHGLYIKLGRSGSWEKECLEKGILRFGYKETPFDAAVAGDWDTVWAAWFGMRKENAGTATRDVTQIRHFFEPNGRGWIVALARAAMKLSSAAPADHGLGEAQNGPAECVLLVTCPTNRSGPARRARFLGKA